MDGKTERLRKVSVLRTDSHRLANAIWRVEIRAGGGWIFSQDWDSWARKYGGVPVRRPPARRPAWGRRAATRPTARGIRRTRERRRGEARP